MDHYEQELEIETNYFNQVLNEIHTQLNAEKDFRLENKSNLIAARKDMWENTNHSSDDFDKLTEISQYLESLELQTASYVSQMDKVKLLEKMTASPYFARIDFQEEDEEVEQIYIGIGTLMDDTTQQIYVYDWRAPIASIFYRFERGKASYEAPVGEIEGTLSLKRQYEIKHGKFEYFFDADVQIQDEFLKQLLSKNASSKMKTIVETIQKDQDVIIRDMENDLLIIQGVAGSGKTSIALHRVAYLMYKGLMSKLRANNIIIISPSSLFGEYISNVLPQLGEDSISSLTFENIYAQLFPTRKYPLQKRNALLEELMSCDDLALKALKKSSVNFKGSVTFTQLLKRYITYCEKYRIPYTDIYYDNQYIFSRSELQSFILRNPLKQPLALRLKKLELIILDKIHELRPVRLAKLEKFIARYPTHMYEIKAFARLISFKESINLRNTICQFTEINYYHLYKHLFKNKVLFYQLAEGLELPDNIDDIIDYTVHNLQNSTQIMYEDSLALLYLKSQMDHIKDYIDIKQVMVDEAQDYYPIHFEILKTLFFNARFTILGDVNQTIEKTTDFSLYDVIQKLFNKKKSAMMCMTKSFRCTTEIISFSEKFIDAATKIENFSRHGEIPTVTVASDLDCLDHLIIDQVKQYTDAGYASIGILCKSAKEATMLYSRLKAYIPIKLFDGTNSDVIENTFILPIYVAKGLEFDAAIIYQVNAQNYYTEDDKKLLYIASTRALHRLSLFYTGNPSPFLV